MSLKFLRANEKGKGGRAPSFKDQATGKETDPKDFVPQTYPKYNLQWPKLKDWLEKRFKGLELEEQVVNNDKYYFKIPDPLTEAEINDIAKLKDVPERKPRGST